MITRISSTHELKYSGVVGAAGAAVLGQALPVAVSLTHLQLPNQRIGAAGTEALCKGLAKNNPSLTYLDLRSNNLLDEGARHVANLLLTDRKVRTPLTPT